VVRAKRRNTGRGENNSSITPSRGTFLGNALKLISKVSCKGKTGERKREGAKRKPLTINDGLKLVWGLLGGRRELSQAMCSKR